MKTRMLVHLWLFGAIGVGIAGELVDDKVVINDEAPWLIKPTWESRWRYEYGDQTSRETSHAGTWRNRIGLLTREVNGVQFFAEYEGTLALDRGSYRAASVHGPVDHTIIADPESHELNQWWGSYKNDLLFLKVGRQGIDLDNQRFVGTVGWRQNNQTFDAVALTVSPINRLELQYHYINRVNRIFGSQVEFAPQTDFEGNTHLVRAQLKETALGTLTTYAYFMDLGNAAGDAASNNTFGFNLAGALTDEVDYYFEYAYQTDGADSPLDYGANYAHGSLSRKVYKGVKGTLGLEYLGADAGKGFRTPLATLHQFNGFADRFLTTPSGGLTDLYGTLASDLPWNMKGAITYHYFWDDDLDASFGQEIDLVLKKPLGNGYTALAKGAYYIGQGGQPDVARFIFQIDYKF